MAQQWFKFYGGEFLSDPKILQLTALERSCWVTLLCLASQSENGEIKFLSETQLLYMSGIADQKIDILEKLSNLDMIRICNGNVTVINWEKRQYSEGYSRVQRFRKRQSNGEDNDRIDKNRIERIDKNTYGEFLNVFLTSEEYLKLAEKIGEKNRDILIEELSAGIASKGYKYKSHYAAILNWARRRYKEHIEKLEKGKSKVAF